MLRINLGEVKERWGPSHVLVTADGLVLEDTLSTQGLH